MTIIKEAIATRLTTPQLDKEKWVAAIQESIVSLTSDNQLQMAEVVHP